MELYLFRGPYSTSIVLSAQLAWREYRPGGISICTFSAGGPRQPCSSGGDDLGACRPGESTEDFCQRLLAGIQSGRARQGYHTSDDMAASGRRTTLRIFWADESEVPAGVEAHPVSIPRF